MRRIRGHIILIDQKEDKFIIQELNPNDDLSALSLMKSNKNTTFVCYYGKNQNPNFNYWMEQMVLKAFDRTPLFFFINPLTDDFGGGIFEILDIKDIGSDRDDNEIEGSTLASGLDDYNGSSFDLTVRDPREIK